MQPTLDITTQRAQIEIITHRASIEITRRRPRLNVTRAAAQMQIDRRAPVMRLDRTAQWQALHIGPVLQQATAYYQQSFNTGLEAIGRIASDGTAMLQIENGGNTFAQLAEQQMEQNTGDLNTSFLPPAEIQWDPGYFSVNWTAHSLQMDWDVSAWADIRVEPGYVEIRMARHPNIVVKVHYDEAAREKKALLNQYV